MTDESESLPEMEDQVQSEASDADVVHISKTEWETTPTTTIGTTTKVVKPPERRGWRSILIRQETFDRLKDLMKKQDRSKKTLDLSGVADGVIAYVLLDPDRANAGVAEGRKRKRDEIIEAANQWAE